MKKANILKFGAGLLLKYRRKKANLELYREQYEKIDFTDASHTNRKAF
jgi:hypothetical protein